MCFRREKGEASRHTVGLFLTAKTQRRSEASAPNLASDNISRITTFTN